MSITDWLFQNQAPTPVASGSDTSTSSPEWLQQYLHSVLSGANAVAGQPYAPFPGPTVAQPSATTQQAWQAGQQNVGNYQPYLQQAQALTQQASAPIDPSQIQNFLNPYQDYITGALNRNLNENLLPGIQDKFVSAGQTRSPQEAELSSRALRDTQTSIGESLAGGYQGAINSLLQQRQQQQTGGAQMGTLGSLQSQLGMADVGSLSAIGQSQDQLSQANINAALQQFQQQQQYPYQQVGFMANILNGLPVQAAGTTQQTVGAGYLNNATPNQSPFQSFLGTAAMAKSLGLKRGGRVGTLAHMSKTRRPAGTLERMAA